MYFPPTSFRTAEWRTAAVRLLAWSWLVPCVVSGAVLALSRPFVSNQNTYLAHAARLSGAYPQLERDWFANNADPTPVFSWLVAPLLRWFGPSSLPFLDAACGAVFFAALVLLGQSLRRTRAETATRWAIACSISALWFAARHHDLWFEGVAGQPLIRYFLEPATFGVCLLVGFALLERQRPRLGVPLVAAAAALHPTYVPSASLIIFAHVLFDDRSTPRQRAGVAAAGLALLVPVVAYVLIAFAPSSPETFHQANHILADVRIPHHADPKRWLPHGGLPHGLLIVLAILLANTRARKKLGLFALYGVAGTVVALLFPELYALRLSFPWRVSAWLVPLSTAIVSTELLSRAGELVQKPRLVAAAASLACLVALYGGVREGLGRLRTRTDLHVALAREAQRRGAPADVLVINPDWENVRLNAPSAVFVDTKSHPYRDQGVIEWQRRLQLAKELYDGAAPSRCETLRKIAYLDPAVRWVVAPVRLRIACTFAKPIDSDQDGVLYRIDPSPNREP